MRKEELEIAQKSHVHCTVENCQWWQSPNLCSAEKIVIVSDESARDLPNEVDVEQINQIVSQTGLSSINDCSECCCKTFVPRDKFQRGEGGINY